MKDSMSQQSSDRSAPNAPSASTIARSPLRIIKNDPTTPPQKTATKPTSALGSMFGRLCDQIDRDIDRLRHS